MSACGEVVRPGGNKGLVRNRTIPHFGECCGENQALFLWAVSLKQEPTEVIQECCLAPEHGRNLPPQAGEDVKDNVELFKQFQDNPSFKQWLSDTVFAQTYRKGGGEG